MFKKKKDLNPPRRSRQLQSQNPNVFSYHSSRVRGDSNVDRLKTEVTKTFHWKFIPSFIALFMIIGSLVYVTSLSTSPRINHGNKQSLVLQADSVYQKAAKKALSRSIFSRSKLLIDTKKVESQLIAEFPELASASITVPLTSRRPIIAILPIQPALFLETRSGVYMVGSNGQAVRKLQNLAPLKDLQLPTVNDESGLDIALGKAALPSDNARFILEVSHQLVAKQVGVDSMTLPEVANELHIRPTGEGYYVKFNMQGDPRLQAGTFVAVKAKLAADKIKPAEYVDVRVNEKAFYK